MIIFHTYIFRLSTVHYNNSFGFISMMHLPRKLFSVNFLPFHNVIWIVAQFLDGVPEGQANNRTYRPVLNHPATFRMEIIMFKGKSCNFCSHSIRVPHLSSGHGC